MNKEKSIRWLRYWAYFALFAFLVFFAWEVLQTPLYDDASAGINTIVWYRLHCTLGDMLILLSAVAITSLVRRKFLWVFSPRAGECAIATVLGVAYTALSEFFNVGVVARWAYSGLMPQLFGIGLVPILQWIVLPTLIVRLVSDHFAGIGQEPNREGA